MPCIIFKRNYNYKKTDSMPWMRIKSVSTWCGSCVTLRSKLSLTPNSLPVWLVREVALAVDLAVWALFFCSFSSLRWSRICSRFCCCSCSSWNCCLSDSPPPSMLWAVLVVGCVVCWAQSSYESQTESTGRDGSETELKLMEMSHSLNSIPLFFTWCWQFMMHIKMRENNFLNKMNLCT